MEPITIDNFKSSPITRGLHQFKRCRILESFPELSTCSREDYLSLWKYLEGTPERFYSLQSYKSMIDFLDDVSTTSPLILEEIFERPEWAPDIAFRTLAEINAREFNDSVVPSDEYEMISFCENHIHPAYLRLVESCFSYFIYPIAAYQRISRNRALDGLDLYNRVEELEGTPYSSLVNHYNNTIRNSIAHGGVIYKHAEIIYQDKSGQVSLSTREIVACYDDLLDICNGLSLGYRVYFCTNRDFLEKHKIRIPLPILVEELKAETEAPGWRIEGCVESEVVGDESQLIVFSTNTFLDPMKLQYHVVRSALLCEMFAPGYAHYFFSLNSRHSLLGYAGFNGEHVEEFRTKGLPEEGNLNIFDHRGLSFRPRPRLPHFVFRISTFISVFRTTISLVIKSTAQEIRPLSMISRVVEVHRNGSFAVVNGSVVLKTTEAEILEETVRANSKAILRKAIRKARKNAKAADISKYLPIGYARILVFSRDMRVRRLRNSGLASELICTVQQKRLERIKAPDILGGFPEEYRGLHIVWNKHSSSIHSRQDDNET